MKALRKDFYMEIRKSMGRFLSLFFIVALGVSLFSGIRATKPDMVLSGDAYADEHKLMDIKVVSTYGLTQEDVDVIEGLPSVVQAIGAYSIDALCEVGDNKKVVHVMSHTENMNLITVEEGRLPEQEGECLVDQEFLESSGYQIGDTITLLSGTEDPLTDTLTETDYRIVGTGSSPLYFSRNRGSSTIGNGSVSGFVIVSPEAFTLDVYTEIYATAEGGEDALSFTDAYEEAVDEATKEISLIQNVRCEIRKNALAEDAQLQIDEARNELNAKKTQAQESISESEEKLKDAQTDIKIGQVQVESGKSQLESAKQQLEESKTEYETIKKYYDNAISSIKSEKEGLESRINEAQIQAEQLEGTEKEVALKAIEGMKESLESINTKLASLQEKADKEFAESEKKISDSEALIQEKEAQLAAAEKSLQEGQQEITSGQTQLEEAKSEMESQLEEGEAKISEAQEQISEIGLPTWYIFGRSSIPGYTDYGENADRVAALAIVFPSIFFLVAALISLTSMTRMVEEERVQIGTYKALGYGKGAIVKKYLYYALSATLGGSAFGVLVGEKIFPYIIIVAYRILYVHVTNLILPYDWGQGILATVIAVCCTGLATLSVCYKSLAEQPAALMRPLSPQVRKRTLIERFTLLWKHLNFTWKSTLRNLFRYKKRFFMTLFGIGGCMGLVLVGYGLRDSITFVGTYQYEALQTYDMGVFISENMKSETKEELLSYLEDNEDVEEHMSVRMSNVSIQGEDREIDGYLTVIGDDKKAGDFFTYQNRRTKKVYELTEEGVILTEKTAKMLGVSAGDTISIAEGSGTAVKVKVTAVCENYLSHYVYMTASLYEKLYGNEPVYNDILIRTAESLDYEDEQKIGEEILEFDDILNVQYTVSLSLQLDDMLGALDQVIIVLIVVAGMLSFVVLYNLNNININERRRELATLKVLGFYDGEVAAYVYRENVMLTFLGAMVGCVFGKFLHLYTIQTVEIDTAMFGRTINLSSYLISAAITIVFSILVNGMMYFKLKKIDMVESLKSVE